MGHQFTEANKRKKTTAGNSNVFLEWNKETTNSNKISLLILDLWHEHYSLHQGIFFGKTSLNVLMKTKKKIHSKVSLKYKCKRREFLVL